MTLLKFMGAVCSHFGDTTYFLRGDSELVAVSRWAGRAKSIASLPIGAELSFDGRYISYQDTNCEVIRYGTIEKTQGVDTTTLDRTDTAPPRKAKNALRPQAVFYAKMQPSPFLFRLYR